MDAELIAKTVAEAKKPAPAAAKAQGSAEAKPQGPPSQANVAAGKPITGKESVVSAVVTSPEQLGPAIDAIDKAVVDDAKRKA